MPLNKLASFNKSTNWTGLKLDDTKYSNYFRIDFFLNFF